MSGKGSSYRPVNKRVYDANYDAIFRRKTEVVETVTSEQSDTETGYSVHEFDSFSNEGWLIKSGLTLLEAKSLCDSKDNGVAMTLYYVFDKNNKKVYQRGKY